MVVNQRVSRIRSPPPLLPPRPLVLFIVAIFPDPRARRAREHDSVKHTVLLSLVSDNARQSRVLGNVDTVPARGHCLTTGDTGHKDTGHKDTGHMPGVTRALTPAPDTPGQSWRWPDERFQAGILLANLNSTAQQVLAPGAKGGDLWSVTFGVYGFASITYHKQLLTQDSFMLGPLATAVVLLNRAVR